MGKKKFSDENQRSDSIKSINWYRLVNMVESLIQLDDLTCLTIIHKNKNTIGGLINKCSNFAYFVRLCPHTYARTQQFLPPLWMVRVLFQNLISPKALHVFPNLSAPSYIYVWVRVMIIAIWSVLMCYLKTILMFGLDKNNVLSTWPN